MQRLLNPIEEKKDNKKKTLAERRPKCPKMCFVVMLMKKDDQHRVSLASHRLTYMYIVIACRCRRSWLRNQKSKDKVEKGFGIARRVWPVTPTMHEGRSTTDAKEETRRSRVAHPRQTSGPHTVVVY